MLNLNGSSVHVRALTTADVEKWNIDLKGYDIATVAAVDVEDLGACLAAAVHVSPQPKLLWSDADGEGTPIVDGQRFAMSLAAMLGVLS